MVFPELDNLLNQSIYKLQQTEKERLILRAMTEVSTFHYDNCLPFRRLCDARGVVPADVASLIELPFLPTSFFKDRLLVSVSADQILREVRSSATTGQSSSRMGLDRQTSRRQTKCFTKTVVDRIGNLRFRFVILDDSSTVKPSDVVSARSSTIRSLLFLASRADTVMAHNETGGLRLDPDRLRSVVEDVCNNKVPTIVFGFTYALYSTVRQLLDERQTFQLPVSSKVIHIGGWKKLEAEKVSPEELLEDCTTVFGVQPHDVVDLYGFTEQAGLIYPTCEQGLRHCPVWSEVIVRDPLTLQPLPHDQPGLLQFLTPIQTSYPGHSVITEDLGVVVGVDQCSCGRNGRAFKMLGRAPEAELRGCSDVFAERLS